MKKNFKKFVLGMALVPCMMFAACTKDISQSDYSDRMANAAINYYENKDGKSMVVTTTTNGSSTWKEKAYYGAYDEHSSDVKFSSEAVGTQKIELFVTGSGEKYTNVRVTETTKVTTKGQRENNAETGLESYTSVTEETTVTTFVVTLTDGLPTGGKAYISNKETVDGVPGEEEKEVYTYSSYSSYLYDIEDILDDVNENVFERGFFENSFMFLDVYGAENEFFANKRDKSFGFKTSISINSVGDREVEKESMSYEYSFKDNLPHKIKVCTEIEVRDDFEEVNYGKMNQSGTRTYEVAISYSCGDIATPAGYDDADSAYYSPDIDVATPPSLGF